MSIESEFRDMMVDTVTVSVRPATRNLYGRLSGTPVPTTYRARVVRMNRMVRDTTGQELVSTTHAWIFGAPGIQPEDEITLPDGTAPQILSVERYPDENGAHHEKVFFT